MLDEKKGKEIKHKIENSYKLIFFVSAEQKLIEDEIVSRLMEAKRWEERLSSYKYLVDKESQVPEEEQLLKVFWVLLK